MILRELQRVLASPNFCNSKRYPGRLKYIVENTLAGKSDLLKERTLGIEVFDRHPTYDTNADTVVRYTAGEVRKRLLLYYSERGRKSSIQISLPAGSYIPEFVHSPDAPLEAVNGTAYPDTYPGAIDSGIVAGNISDAKDPANLLAIETGVDSTARRRHAATSNRRLLWLALTALLVLGLCGVWRWKYLAAQPETALDQFWAPVLRDQRTVLVCTGGSVFSQNSYTGNVVTAGRDIDYPFVSIQIASAIAQLSVLLEHSGTATQLQPSASTTLTELREHSVILLGGYNNQWTLRLLEPLRFHFTAEPVESISDQLNPQAHWARDHSLPYSSSDDYALVARYRDTTTDGWVVELAGLGRNGTEAAAQFASSPHYMQLLRDQMGSGFASRNIEAVLKVSVIDGKTGAPSILAVHAW